MNDSAIIRAISKIHSTIIDLLIFIFAALFTIYFTLHIGLKMDNFILPGINIEQLYIKWDEKIVVDIESIKITKSNTRSTFNIKSIDPQSLLKQSRILDSLFSDITIKNIHYNDINATFRYIEHDAGYVNIDGPMLKLTTAVTMNDDHLLINIKDLQELSNKSSMNGKILIDTNERKLYGDLNINAGDVMPLKLYLLADQEKVRLWGKGAQPFTKPIKPAIRIAHLHPKVEPWVADYHSGKTVTLEYFKGTLVYDDPITLLDTLDARLRYDDMQYTFAPGYAPVYAKYTDVTFKDRVLNIYPREATYYGQPGEKTWLKIDFTDPSHPVLTVDVDTNAQLTKEMLPWLKGYGITLPFYQTKGTTTVKLAIAVALNHIHVNAEGYFKTDEATFNFSNTDIDVKNVLVNLKDTDVDIQKLNASLLDNAINAEFKGKINPVKQTGKFTIALHRLHFQNGGNVFEMDPQYAPLNFSYLIKPNKDRLTIPKSYWLFNQSPITINPLHAPFDFSSLSGHVPTVLVSSGNLFKSYVTGQFNIKKLQTDLTVDLLTLKTPLLSLQQTYIPLEIKYKDGLYINVKKQSEWKLGNNRFTLFPSILSYKEDLLYIQDAHFSLNNILDSYLSGAYNTLDDRGTFTLKGLQAKTDDTVLLATRRDLKVFLKKKGNEHLVTIPALDLNYQKDKAGWSVDINNINNLSALSPFLTEYNMTKGEMHLRSRTDSDTINLHGNLPYPYSILVKNNVPLNTFSFSGTYDNDQLALTINDDIQANLRNNRLAIKAKDIGFDLFAISDLIKDHPVVDTNTTKSRFRVKIEADNSYLYLNEARRIPADRLLLQYANKDLNTQLLHGEKGGIALEYSNKKLFIYGDGLNDAFMNELAEFSDFKGGELSFYISGSTDDLEGVIQIKKTIVKDYKIISNIFAFINTIPALVTFSVPHYTTKGLKVNDAYAGFSLKENMLTIKGFHVNAEELAFNGKGTVDLNTRTLDVETSLVTDATKNLARIPFLGYILVGKEDNKATTTITLTGAITDPKIENTLAKDIGIAPFNILKRALTFPAHYIDKAQQAIDEKKSEQ
ncbi:AsmA-like C-terminal domain-containing protein [Sulfurimonas sp. HSL3-7]|uniref:YhdP family protein n=1 Tax=Sulfonitrofixus jiaomeiensis TaxID=3131938 RepID=UPI0031F939A9